MTCQLNSQGRANDTPDCVVLISHTTRSHRKSRTLLSGFFLCYADTMNQLKLTRQAFGLTIGLCLQFLLGVWVSLYIAFPENVSTDELWKFANKQPVLVLHILIGTLLLLGAVALMIQAFRSKQRRWKLGSGIGFTSILLAWLCGERFVATQNDAFSFAMAVFFLTAALAYGQTIYKTSTQKQT